MIDSGQIKKAIAAHGFWRIHLKEAVDKGKSQFDAETVRKDSQCDFGKWIHGLPLQERMSEHWRKARELHADFHKEAARVLDLVAQGHRLDAEAALDPKGAFSRVSDQLTLVLMAWEKHLKG